MAVIFPIEVNSANFSPLVAHIAKKYDIDCTFHKILYPFNFVEWTETLLIYPEISKVFSHFNVKQQKNLLTICIITKNSTQHTWLHSRDMDNAILYLADLYKFSAIRVVVYDN